MKLALISMAISLANMLASNAAHAWVYSDGVTISQVIQWEENPYVIINLSNNTRCYLASSDKQLHALVLMLYAMDGRVNAVCHDLAEGINGYADARKLHRLIAVKP